MKKALEYRASYDIRSTADGDGAEVEGYIATFNTIDSYASAFAPGAFTKTLAERGDRLPMLYQHDPSVNVGIPIESKVDERGLHATAKLFDDGAEGSTLSKRLRQGARYGFSFGFMPVAERMATEDDFLDMNQAPWPDLAKTDVRLITEVKLYEYSIVTFPANERAEIDAVRSAAQIDGVRSLLAAIRDGNLTDQQRTILDEIVAAYGSAPDGISRTTPEPAIARRRIDVDIALARYSYGV